MQPINRSNNIIKRSISSTSQSERKQKDTIIRCLYKHQDAQAIPWERAEHHYALLPFTFLVPKWPGHTDFWVRQLLLFPTLPHSDATESGSSEVVKKDKDRSKSEAVSRGMGQDNETGQRNITQQRRMEETVTRMPHSRQSDKDSSLSTVSDIQYLHATDAVQCRGEATAGDETVSGEHSCVAGSEKSQRRETGEKD